MLPDKKTKTNIGVVTCIILQLSSDYSPFAPRYMSVLIKNVDTGLRGVSTL